MLDDSTIHREKAEVGRGGRPHNTGCRFHFCHHSLPELGQVRVLNPTAKKGGR